MIKQTLFFWHTWNICIYIIAFACNVGGIAEVAEDARCNASVIYWLTPSTIKTQYLTLTNFNYSWSYGSNVKRIENITKGLTIITFINDRIYRATVGLLNIRLDILIFPRTIFPALFTSRHFIQRGVKRNAPKHKRSALIGLLFAAYLK